MISNEAAKALVQQCDPTPRLAPNRAATWNSIPAEPELKKSFMPRPSIYAPKVICDPIGGPDIEELQLKRISGVLQKPFKLDMVNTGDDLII